MLNINKIIDESLDSIWSPRQYQAGSYAPRKDQGPLFNQKDGKNFPYQHNAPPTFPPSLPEPVNPQVFPWPLETINADLGDGFVFLLSAAKKIKQCSTQNPSISQKQKDKLDQIFDYMLKVLKAVEKVGLNLPSVVTMTSERPPQFPLMPTKSPYIPTTASVGSQDSPNLQSQKL
jgi:hypothetical protein